MALVKHNNNSISAVTSMASLSTGSMTLISEQTASSSASVSFTTGIDSTYPIYKFEIINMNPATTNAIFEFQGNASGGSGFNETITSTSFRAYHRENDSDSSLQYVINDDQAQGTDYQHLANGVGNGSDESLCLELFLFNPSSTTFVKHFMARCIFYEDSNMPVDHYTAGYFNTTSAIDEIAFRMHTGNIDSGTFKLYGIRDS
jgi:hypothetical protein